MARTARKSMIHVEYFYFRSIHFFTDGLKALIVNQLFIVFQIRDRMAAEGVEPLEEDIPNEDIIGRDYCRYNVKQGP